MRLGGPLFEEFSSPEEWIDILNRERYTAAYCPVDLDAEDKTIKNYKDAARDNDILIAETGGWSNPLSPDKEQRSDARKKCKKALEVAEKIGANCSVTIAGTRAQKWDAPHEDNFSQEMWDEIVICIREIIDDVDPQNAFYTLETMPWMVPDSLKSCQKLIKDVNREQFAIHYDPVNLINSPRRYFNRKEIISKFIKQLSTEIKSVHLRDTLLTSQLTVQIKETLPGEGELDYEFLLTQLNKLKPNMPVLLEHLNNIQERRVATNFIRVVAQNINIEL